jgi:hypothetical protein
MKPGDKVNNTMRGRTGIIVSFPQAPTAACTVDYGDGKGPSVTTKAYLELLKPVRVPTWQRRLGIRVSDCPPVSERLLVPGIARVSKVRTPCPEKWEVSCREMFDREGVSYPHDWRGTKLGKRKADAEEQRSISATVWIPLEVVSEELLHDLTVVPFGEAGEPLGKVKDDFVVFNNFEYTMKLLVDGKVYGWRITESV